MQEAAKGVAEVMVGAGNLDKALDDYSPFVDASFLELTADAALSGRMHDIAIDRVSMVYALPDGGSGACARRRLAEIGAGEIVTVLGPSGCGKTTLLNIVAGFLRPTRGEVPVGGRPVTGPGAERGMVFQQGALFEWLTVAGNVGVRAADGRAAGARRRRRRSRSCSRPSGCAGFGDTPVYQLSGGMQQRVALARCLANDPAVILMDEPLGALDALTREKMQGLVLRLWKETGKTIMLITHSVEEALFLGERLIVMAPRPGRIEREYPPAVRRARRCTTIRAAIKASPEFVAVREEILSMIWEHGGADHGRGRTLSEEPRPPRARGLARARRRRAHPAEDREVRRRRRGRLGAGLVDRWSSRRCCCSGRWPRPSAGSSRSTGRRSAAPGTGWCGSRPRASATSRSGSTSGSASTGCCRGCFYGALVGIPLGFAMGLSSVARGLFDPIVEFMRPIPPLALIPLIILWFGIDETAKIFLLFLAALFIMTIAARAGVVERAHLQGARGLSPRRLAAARCCAT